MRSPHPYRLIVALACALGSTLAAPVEAQTTRDGFWIADGAVRAAARSGNTLYVGGDFSSFGPPLGSAVALDPASGLVLQAPKVVGEVHAAVSDGAGGWYFAGLFDHVLGEPRTNLAHVLANGTLDPWSPGTNGRVRSLALSGSTLYLGGEFTMVEGQPRARLAALDAATGSLATWNPGADDRVSAIATNGTKVYVGGRFANVGGQNRTFLAEIDAATGLASTWNAQADHYVNALVLNGTTLYAAGFFAHLGSNLFRFYVSAVDVATAQCPPSWTWQGFAMDGPFFGLALSGSVLYAGGPTGVIGIDAVTGSPTGWKAASNSTVFALATSGTTVYAGGIFTTIAGQPRDNLAALDGSVPTATATAWNPRPNGPVLAIVPGSSVFVGGEFASANVVSRSRLAALDLTTGQATPWNPGADGSVTALAAGGPALYVGGSFASAGGQPRNRIAAIDYATGAATVWDPGADGPVQALAVGVTGLVYAGGAYTTIAGAPRSGLAAIHPATGLATAWDPSPNGAVSSIAVDGGTIYAGGAFTVIGAQFRNRIASLESTSGLAKPWNPWANAEVRAIAVTPEAVYLGGDFTTLGGQFRNRIAAVDPSGNPTAWNPGADGSVRALLVQVGAIYAAGSFTSIGGAARSRLAGLVLATGLPLAWDPGPGQDVFALADGGANSLAAAGAFRRLATTPHAFTALFDGTGTVDVPGDDRPFAAGLERVGPNPAAGPVTIDFALPRAARVRIRVLDLQGREVATPLDGAMPAGRGRVTWNPHAGRVPATAGVYFVRYEAEGVSAAKRLVLLR